MIGTDEMSSTGMDISETFRAEELTKTDFFDFVSAPDMGIGIGVGADVVDIGMGVGSLHAGSVSTGTHQHHQQHQQQQHTHHQQHSHQQQQQQQQQQHAHHQQQQQQHSHEQSNNLAGSMPHDGGGGTSGGSACVGGRVGTPGNGSSCIDGSDGNSNGNSSDPTLQGYEFWHADKDPTSRLDATIFEDLDRYCWQQQAVVNAAASPVPTTAATHQHRATPANSLQHSSHLHSPASPNQTHPHQQQQQHLHHQSPHQHMHTQQQQQQQQHQQSAAIHHTQRQMSLNNSSSCAQQSATQVANNNATNNNTSLSHNHSNNNNNNSNNTSNNNGNASMTVDNSDGQIYTITVLNGNESWLKREPEDAAAQLSNTLDLDSLLGSFPGYIKSEYPYDESPAGYGTAEGSGRDGNMTGDMVNGLGMGANAATGLHGGNSGSGVNSQRLPSLVTAISLAGGVGGMGGVGSPSQLAQFQNNNNDWHMADHNAEQNSAESLLRSALQGKGYSKGIHMQNGISLLPSSPTVKEEEMRRLLFPPDTDTLSFGDSALSAAQMFEDTHPSQLVGNQHPNGGVNSAGVSSLMVDDMFLSLESAFSDDFEKIKRIANEVQQFCSPTSSADYGASDVLMQISPAAGANVGAASVQQLQQQQQQQLLSPATTPTSMPQQQQLSPLPQAAMPALHMTGPQSAVGQPAPRVLHAQQQHVAGGKASAVSSSSGTSSGSTTKVTKKYKRSTSSTQHHNNNNNNNPNITNHNSSTGNGGSGQSASGATANSANGPTSGGSSSSTSSNSPTHCNGQRKERSLHYCSICSKGFKDKYSVNVHIRTHTGEKPFTCSLCGKSFRQKAHLAKHYQTHMAQKHNGGLVKSSGGSGGGGGGSNSSKHQRAAAAAAAATAAAVAAAASAQSASGGMSIVPNSCAGSVVAAAVHQRQLNVATSLGMAAGVRAVAGGVVSTVSVGGPMNGPTLGAVNANVLPPANGLLANR